MNKQKQENGITLLTLVITIIILLILAAITLNAIIGENGIFRKAQYAKEQYLNAQEREQKDLNKLYSELLIATNDSSQITVNVEDLNKIIDAKIEERMSESSKAKNPTGTIISYMGTNAPEGYLFCDGTVYNISEYSELAEQIKSEFGSYSYWGGDGETTFAVPNLQGEFLRGYSKSAGASRSSGVTTASVGGNQPATTIPHMNTRVQPNGNGLIWFNKSKESQDNNDSPYNMDTFINNTANLQEIVFTASSPHPNTWSTYAPTSYTVRPTNTSVLYCIKY